MTTTVVVKCNGPSYRARVTGGTARAESFVYAGQTDAAQFGVGADAALTVSEEYSATGWDAETGLPVVLEENKLPEAGSGPTNDPSPTGEIAEPA